MKEGAEIDIMISILLHEFCQNITKCRGLVYTMLDRIFNRWIMMHIRNTFGISFYLILPIKNDNTHSSYSEYTIVL